MKRRKCDERCGRTTDGAEVRASAVSRGTRPKQRTDALEGATERGCSGQWKVEKVG